MERDVTKIRAAVERVAQKAAGGQIRRLALLLDVSTQAIYKWVNEGVPVRRALEMSLLAKGEVQWYELVPEVLAELREKLKVMESGND